MSRGIYDIRLWVEGEDDRQVEARVREFLRRMQIMAPPTIEVRDARLLAPSSDERCGATMRPRAAR